MTSALFDPLRFGGTQRLYGTELTNQLVQSHICVIGIGGVGSWVAEALARTAVGEITLIDLDDICLSNTNRQAHTLDSTIGQMKITAMGERLKAINPDIKINEVHDFVTPNNFESLITHQFDYVVDAIDSVKVKAALLNHCKRSKIPCIMIGGAGGQTDPTKIAVTDLSKTEQDPLAAKVRNILRREYGFVKSTEKTKNNRKSNFGIDAVYSSEPLKYPQADGSVCASKEFAGQSGRLDCATGFGAATVVTASFAFVAVAKIIEKINIKMLKEKKQTQFPYITRNETQNTI
jgi:tRNA threonylcarbamoyladenosine dehydratase